MKGPKQGEELVPIARAAGELRQSYFATRDLALRGALVLVWKGTRMFVTRASLDRRKASMHEGREPAIAGS